jgi:hypothetical protein
VANWQLRRDWQRIESATVLLPAIIVDVSLPSLVIVAHFGGRLSTE